LIKEQRTGRSWAPCVTGPIAAHAIDVAKDVAARFRDRERLLRINRAAEGQTRYPGTVHWESHALAQGDAGLALACAYFDPCWPGESWLDIGERYLSLAADQAEAVLPRLGMFSGLAGLAFAARSYSSRHARYQRLLSWLDPALSTHALAAAGKLRGRHGVAVAEFDLISGLCGVGAYFLSAGVPPPTDVALHAILETLVALTETSDGVPHWYTPQSLMSDNPMSKFFPEGNLNCGLAHGIPGPLAMMALALESGFGVDGLAEAIERTADWLVRHQTADHYGVNWPTAVPWTPQGRVPSERLDASRAAWCYGTPGVARALWLAGRAIGAYSLCHLAVEGMTAVYRRPVSMRRIDSPTFCHGVAGLLQVTMRFLFDTDLPVFHDAAGELCQQLLSQYQADRPLGFCCIEPDGNLVDQAGLLDGALGVVLVLLAASTYQAPNWDRLFLLT
jgi:class I lanthipeptide synthase